ncbi:hypothetical protein SDC9_162091 [bioreactor metagenome]|uniref:Uncharacterized protein n=1 Tax=bioreactor metagenome TaxID=1076179 RepID=A0A645FMH7_9ZZZZ
MHRVVDGQSVGDASARRIDVYTDVFGGIFRFQKEQLGHHHIGRGLCDLFSEYDDAVPQQPGVNIERTFAYAGMLDDDRNER